MKEILHFYGQKSFLMLQRKPLERESFGKRGRRCHPSPPPTPCLDKMTQDIKISKFLNIWLKWQIVNGFKLEVNGHFSWAVLH